MPSNQRQLGTGSKYQVGSAVVVDDIKCWMISSVVDGMKCGG